MYAGEPLSVLMLDDTSMITLSSLAKVIGESGDNIRNWLLRLHGFGAEVNGSNYQLTTAYSVDAIVDYFNYRMTLTDDVANRIKALVLAGFCNDIDVAIKHHFGIEVTHAQQEQNRLSTRTRLIMDIADSIKGGRLQPQTSFDAGLNKVEADIAGKIAYIRSKQKMYSQDKSLKADTAYRVGFMSGELLKLGVSQAEIDLIVAADPFSKLS